MICNRKLSLQLKKKFYSTIIRPAILYKTEHLIAKSQQESKLIEMRILRWMCGYTRKDTTRNTIIRDEI
jgi:hypothetical protein